MNVVVLRGSLSKPAEPRELPSGDQLVAYEVTVPASGAIGTETVPVVWHQAPAEAAELDKGTEVAVLGRVRRRLFRAGGVTQSRTEVVAERVVPAANGRRVSTLVRAAERSLGGDGASPP